jgi:hypothetical protein
MVHNNNNSNNMKIYNNFTMYGRIRCKSKIIMILSIIILSITNKIIIIIICIICIIALYKIGWKDGHRVLMHILIKDKV